MALLEEMSYLQNNILSLSTKETFSALDHMTVLISFDRLMQLTYLLTPYSTVLLEKLTGSAASQEIPRIFEPECSSPHPQVPATCPYTQYPH